MKDEIVPFPWAMIMQFGLGTLRLPADIFWRTTPREMAAALNAFSGRRFSPPQRAEFEALMKRFPDRPEAGVQIHE